MDDDSPRWCWNRPEELYHAHFDCFSGAAGDMILAACLDSVESNDDSSVYDNDDGRQSGGNDYGPAVSKQTKLLQHITYCIEQGMPELKGEFQIHAKKVWRGGMASIAATHVTVRYDHEPAPVPMSTPGTTNSHIHDHEHSHEHSHGHSHEHFHEHAASSGGEYDNNNQGSPEIQHPSSTSNHHHHHHHRHGHSQFSSTCDGSNDSKRILRNLPQIRTMLEQAQERYIPIWVRDMAIRTFTILANAEAKTHGSANADTVFFHEVGAIDSIVDTVGSLLALYNLGITTVSCGRLPVGEGTVWTDHGLLPVPAPATLRILAGMPLCQVRKENKKAFQSLC